LPPDFDAHVRTETWRRYYNTERRHTSLGYRTPQQYFEQSPCACACASQEVIRTDIIEPSASAI
jgi:hypothetical protein